MIFSLNRNTSLICEMFKKIRYWKELNKSRKISCLMSIFLIIAGLIISAVNILAYLSIESISYNVIIPNDEPELKLNISNMESNYLKVPYKISNEGYFDIIDIKMKVKIDYLYSNNDSNKEIRRTVFSKKANLVSIKPGDELTGVFKGEYLNFDNSEIILFLEELDISKEIKRLMDVQISASLSGLVQFHIEFEDIDIDGDKFK